MLDEKRLNEQIDWFEKNFSKYSFVQFLKFLKGEYEDYLDGKNSEGYIASLTLNWIQRDEFFEKLVKYDSRLEKLKEGIDITHPDFSKERKEDILRIGLVIINSILNEFKN